AVGFALLIGWAAFRLRGAYFAIGTLALSEIFRITVGNTLAEISTLPQRTIATYRLANRYWLALALAALSILAVAALARSRLGLGWVDFRLLIFGALFVAIVLLLPGGLVEAMGKLRGLFESAALTPDRQRPRPEHR